jgi:hypothetical protein
VDLDAILKQLREERAHLSEAILALEHMHSWGKRRGASAGLAGSSEGSGHKGTMGGG